MSVVIPVWNDSERLARLVEQLLSLPRVGQIVVVDDGSDPPCILPDEAGGADPRLRLLRSPEQRGAGHARNIGLTAVTMPWVLFFDSDDLPLPEMAALLADLAKDGGRFDFCLFRHLDSRVRAAGGWGPLPGDQRYWAALAAPERPVPIDRAAAVQMVRIAAYPWNKIYRTDFLREAAIRCTEIPVHNDIELHWTSFLRARSVLVSSRVCCEHFVDESGARLTNRSGVERFAVFAALEAVLADLRGRPDQAAVFAEPAADFCLRLFDWICSVLEPDLRAPFRAEARAFLRRALTPGMFVLIAIRRLDTARAINDFLTETGP